jgi:hypothetical protein
MSLKQTSDPIAVSFGLNETAPNTFIEEEIALQLDVLNNEVFVVLAIDIDLTSPSALAATDTSVKASLCATSQTAVSNLSNSNCLASGRKDIEAAGFVDGGVAFERQALTTPTGDVPYIGIISTNNFFVQLQGQNNPATKGVTGRVWGYRARASSDTYAALVQSEVLSA